MKEELMKIFIKHGVDPIFYTEMTNEILGLFGFKEPNPVICPHCGAGEIDQSRFSKWDKGKDFRCDKCGKEWECNE